MEIYSKAKHQAAIIDWLSHGKTLTDYCRIQHHPSTRTVYDWMQKSEDFASHIARARITGYDVIADECMKLADTPPTDQVQNNWRRLQIETRLKLLAKWSPDRYGERTAIDHAGGISLVVVTGVPQPDALTGRVSDDPPQIT